MKRLIFTAIAVALATPVLAQTTPPAPPAADPAMAQPAPAAPATDPAMTPPAPAADPAMAAPAAPTTTPDANMSAATPAAAPMPATGTYPMCSKTVTDQCTERSNRKGERLHSTPRPKK